MQILDYLYNANSFCYVSDGRWTYHSESFNAYNLMTTITEIDPYHDWW